jgi:hypothetical protein
VQSDHAGLGNSTLTRVRIAVVKGKPCPKVLSLFFLPSSVTLNAVPMPYAVLRFPLQISEAYLRLLSQGLSSMISQLASYPHIEPPFATQERENFCRPNITTNRSSSLPAHTAPKMSSALSLYFKSNELPCSTSPTSPGKTSPANHLPLSIHPPRSPSRWLPAAAAAAAAAAT